MADSLVSTSIKSLYDVIDNGTGNSSQMEYNFTDHDLGAGAAGIQNGGGDDTGGRSLAQMLWIFCGPVVFVAGVCGNSLILAIMGSKKMQGTTTSVYLRLMAIADMCVLFTGMIPEWLENSSVVKFKELNAVTCKMEKFLNYTSGDTAIWILVIFTVDRFIAVNFPLSKKEFCVPSKAKWFALGAFLLACTKNFHVFWTRGPQYKVVGNDTWNQTVLKRMCGRPTEAFRYFEFYVRPWIAFSMCSVIPFCIIIICNIFIIRSLVMVKRLRSQQSIVSNSDKTFIQMTAMCLSASFCFLICITPSIVILIGRPYWYQESWYEILKAINNQLVYVNHSINFFLYCLTGKRFRHELIGLCRRSSAHGLSSDSETKTSVYRVTFTNHRGQSVRNGGGNGALYTKLDKCAAAKKARQSPPVPKLVPVNVELKNHEHRLKNLNNFHEKKEYESVM